MCPKLEGSQRTEGREIRHPELLYVFILLPPPLPEAGGLHGVQTAPESLLSQPGVRVGLVGSGVCISRW